MRPDRRDIVITGIGLVSPLGVGVGAFWERACAGEATPGETPVDERDIPRPARAFTLSAVGFRAEDHIAARTIRRYSAFSTLAVIAAHEAAATASVREALESARDEVHDEAGVVLGTAFGSSDYHFEYYEALFRHGVKEASPLLFSESVLNAASGHVTQQLGLRGAGLTLVGGEDVGAQALMTALDRVRAGAALFVAGGVEQYCSIIHATLGRCDAVGDDRGNPYAGVDSPSAFGEGAGLVVCEPLAAARARGVAPIAVLRGAAAGRSPHAARRDGGHVASVITLALEDARVAPSDVDIVVGSGKGAASDEVELDGVLHALGERSDRERVLVAPKSLVGESFGFASAAQAIVAALSLSTGRVPRTPSSASLPAGWRMAGGERREARVALVVSTTPAGGVTAMVLRRH